MSEDTGTPRQPASPGGFWTQEKLDLWMRVGIPALATLVIGIATLYINHSISERAEREQSSRLYTELISRREQASSAVRKDMFATILSGFLGSGATGDTLAGSKRLDRDLMKLELLALNFGETLSLGPLFSMMDRRIRTDASYASNLERVDRRDFQQRLESLARRVADAQRGSLERQSKEFTIKIPSARIGESGSYEWPETPEQEILACQTLGRAQRNFIFTFDNPNAEARTIRVALVIRTLALSREAPAACVEALSEACYGELPDRCVPFQKRSGTTDKFTLNTFNLPLIDNSLLSNNQRFAMVMRKFSTDSETEVLGILFPGTYAGRRDKITLDQAIESLKDGPQ